MNENQTQLPWQLVNGEIVATSKEGTVTKVAKIGDKFEGIESKDAKFIVEACNNYKMCLSLLTQLRDLLPKARKVDEIETFLVQRGVRK